MNIFERDSQFNKLSIPSIVVVDACEHCEIMLHS